MTERRESQRRSSRIDRRGFLQGLTLAGGGLLLGACQPQGPAAAPARSTPTVAGAASAPAGWESQWNTLVEAARQEGRIVVSGPPSTEVRTQLPAAFRQRFGVEMEYLGGRTTELMTRLKAERAADQHTLDAMIAGAQSLYTNAYPEKILDPIAPILIHPEATDPTKWIKGHPWFMDPDQQYILRVANYISAGISINTQHVNASEIKRYADLLDPKYRGRISVYDPIRPGTGWNTANYLLRMLGEDFIRALYQDQQPGVSNEDRVLSDWMARGRYPISLGLGSREIEALKAEGFPIDVVRDPPDAPGHVSAGFGLVALVNKAPHPNAAKLFVNWMAMKEGNETYTRAEVLVSTRADVDSAWAPPYIVPKPGVDYFDTYDWDFTVSSRAPEEIARLRHLTGQN